MSLESEGTIMAFSLKSLTSLFAGFDFVGEATKAITISESLGPLLMKAAADGYAAASAPNPKSIIAVLSDIEAFIPAAHDALTANNVHVVASVGGTAVQTPESATASATAVAPPAQVAAEAASLAESTSALDSNPNPS